MTRYECYDFNANDYKRITELTCLDQIEMNDEELFKHDDFTMSTQLLMNTGQLLI